MSKLQKSKKIKPMHPGELIREDILPELDISKVKLANMLDISRQTLYDILGEKQSVTAEMALKIGKLFGNGPVFWLNLQRNYDLYYAEEAVDLDAISTLETAG